MSSKSKRPGKKISLPSQPRDMETVNQEYGRLVAQAGQAQYQVYVYTEDLKRLNEALRNLNYEAAARQNLDSQTKIEPKAEETASA